MEGPHIIDYSKLSLGFAASDFLSILFTGVFVVWVVYSIIAAYHWFRYGHDSWMAAPAIFVHLFISGWLFIYATSGFH